MTKEQINKFNYLSEEEIKDIWYKEENKLFEPLRNAINCINVLSCSRPAYQPYSKIESHAVHFIINVTNEKVIGAGLRVLTRAIDRRYNGVVDWECKIEHTDHDRHYIIWLDSGYNTRNKDLSEVVAESNEISFNIMNVLDTQSTLDFFEKNNSYTKHGYDHINSKKFKKIEKIHKRSEKIENLING